MRVPNSLLFMGVFALTISGCQESDQSPTASSAGQTIAEQIVETTGSKPSSDTTPCEILDDGLIRAHFDIGNDVEISRSPSKYSPHPLCSVSWPKPNAEEIQRKAAEGMAEYLQKKRQGEDLKMPSFQTTNEVTLTVLTPTFDSAEQALSAFDSSMKTLSDGITRSHNGVEITFQADLDAVDGIGDKAMWAAQMRQLSVVYGNQIFHLTTNTGADINAELENARALARDVVSRL